MKIEIKNIYKKFKNTLVLNNVNITFEKGKIYGLIGRNGSGKSVFLKLLCGFYAPTSGEILIDGVNINKNKEFLPNARALIEKPNFLLDLSGIDNLRLLASIQKKISEKEIVKALETVQLIDEKNKKFAHYSLGMKQKLGIAQVLMEAPDIMIFDEPFNGVEESTTNKLRAHLTEIKKDKIIIIASHIKEDIYGLADEVYKFEDGYVTKVSIKENFKK